MLQKIQNGHQNVKLTVLTMKKTVIEMAYFAMKKSFNRKRIVFCIYYFRV